MAEIARSRVLAETNFSEHSPPDPPFPGGFAGKILRVNLSENRITTEKNNETFYRKYVGGSGIISQFLLKELGANIDPLGPENKLIFAPGPLTGTTIIGTARNGVGAKSPLGGSMALSQVGEVWGVELKKAGYDALIVEGTAAKPVYLWIKDGQVQIREADHLWGQKTKETQEMIRAELEDERIRLALIGPGGENLVRFACIMNGLFDAAGRGGLGAVMGSKKLKAIAVKGTNSPRVVNAEKTRDLNKWLLDHLYDNPIAVIIHEYGTGGPELEQVEQLGDIPVRNWREGEFPQIKKIHGVAIRDSIRVGMDGCYACPIRCKKRVKFEEPYRVDPDYGGPEYEGLSALGSNCGIDDLKAIAKANELCNAYSLDSISTGSVIAFAMECFEKGLLTQQDTGGIELKFGNAEALLQCVELIGEVRGFGKILAEGTARMSKKIGRGSEAFAMQVKGVEAGQHEPRLMPCMGLGFMVNPQGADHCMPPHDNGLSNPRSVGWLRSWGFIEPFPDGDMGPRKVAFFKMGNISQVIIDCLVMCHLSTIGLGDRMIADIVAAVTGWNTTPQELSRLGERVLTMARLFGVRQGLSAQDDVLPLRYFQPKANGALSRTALDPNKMEKAKRYYYRLMGWNQEGVPTPEKIEELEIDI
jgi:aldehyde:ferredoxin oxidoreductase